MTHGFSSIIHQTPSCPPAKKDYRPRFHKFHKRKHRRTNVAVLFESLETYISRFYSSYCGPFDHHRFVEVHAETYSLLREPSEDELICLLLACLGIEY